MNEPISHLNERNPKDIKVRLKKPKRIESYYLYQQGTLKSSVLNLEQYSMLDNLLGIFL